MGLTSLYAPEFPLWKGKSMKITVITGTMVKGCTYRIKELFLENLRDGNDITEFYLPRDMPEFCTGCKTCFFKDERLCPHAKYVLPIWEAIMDADLLVFTTPVYALRASGQMKALLDHFCVHWLVHRPEEKMWNKKAVILTNAVGFFNSGAQNDIATSLLWLGISDVKKLGVGLMEGVIWGELSEKRRKTIEAKAKKLALRYKKPYNSHKGIKVRALFAVTKIILNPD